MSQFNSTTSDQELQQLRLNFQFTVDQLQADRDFWMQDSVEKGKQIEVKDRRIAWLEKNYTGTKKQLKWQEDVLTHPALKPIEASILIELAGIKSRMVPIADGELAGKWKAQRNDLKVGDVKDFDTITKGMQALSRKGFISYELDKSRGTRSQAYAFDIPEIVMKEPRSYRPAEEKLARPKKDTSCPSCTSPRIKKIRKKGTLCECKDCTHQWMEDEHEKVIMEAGVLPQDYAESARHQKEAEKDFDSAFKAANSDKPQQTSFKEETVTSQFIETAPPLNVREQYDYWTRQYGDFLEEDDNGFLDLNDTCIDVELRFFIEQPGVRDALKAIRQEAV